MEELNEARLVEQGKGSSEKPPFAASMYLADTLRQMMWLIGFPTTTSNTFLSLKVRSQRNRIKLTSQPSLQSSETFHWTLSINFKFLASASFSEHPAKLLENLFKFLLCERVLLCEQNSLWGKFLCKHLPRPQIYSSGQHFDGEVPVPEKNVW